MTKKSSKKKEYPELVTEMEISILRASTRFNVIVANLVKEKSEKIGVNDEIGYEKFDAKELEKSELVMYNLTNLLHDSTKLIEMVMRRSYSLQEDLPIETTLATLANLYGEITVHNVFGNDVTELQKALKTLEEEILKYIQFILSKENIAKIKENILVRLNKVMPDLDTFATIVEKTNPGLMTLRVTVRTLSSELSNVTNKAKEKAINLKEKLTQSNGNDDLTILISDFVELLKLTATARQLTNCIDEYFYHHNKNLGIYQFIREITERLADSFFDM
ncbi:MAG: hypothetical protein QW478_14850 [Candidatus Micrarchaeaceae archaeon]